jgi:hypothetical protein
MPGSPLQLSIASCEPPKGDTDLKVTPLTLPHGHFWEVHISPGFILRWEHADQRGGLLIFDLEDLTEVRGESRAAFGIDLLEIDKIQEALRLWQAHYTAALKLREEA